MPNTINNYKLGHLGINLIKHVEGIKKELYKCTGGFYTIGIGHRCSKKEVVEFQDGIDDNKVMKLFNKDILIPEKTIYDFVNIELTQNQFDALVSWIFNLGRDNFRTSTLLKKLNNNDIESSANEFDRWIYSGGKITKGLITRRSLEKDMFLGFHLYKWF